MRPRQPSIGITELYNRMVMSVVSSDSSPQLFLQVMEECQNGRNCLCRWVGSVFAAFLQSPIRLMARRIDSVFDDGGGCDHTSIYSS